MKTIGFAVLAMLTASLGVATASTQNDASTCRAAIAEEAPQGYDVTSLRFDRVRGATLRRLTFKINRSDSETVNVICHVRRGDVVEIIWPAASN